MLICLALATPILWTAGIYYKCLRTFHNGQNGHPLHSSVPPICFSFFPIVCWLKKNLWCGVSTFSVVWQPQGPANGHCLQPDWEVTWLWKGLAAARNCITFLVPRSNKNMKYLESLSECSDQILLIMNAFPGFVPCNWLLAHCGCTVFSGNNATFPEVSSFLAILKYVEVTESIYVSQKVLWRWLELCTDCLQRL